MEQPQYLYLSAGALGGDGHAMLWDGDGHSLTLPLAALLAGDGPTPGPVQLILSAADVLVTSVHLSRRQARHIGKVLPFLLEESLLDSADTLWFAHGKPQEQDYPVLVCQRSALEQLLARLVDAGWIASGAWVDGSLLSALGPLQVAQEQELLWVAANHQALVLPLSDQQQVEALLASEPDQAAATISDDATLRDRLQQALAADQAPNLLHGALRPVPERSALAAAFVPWRSVTRYAAVVLLAIWGITGAQSWYYDRAARAEGERAVALYQELFPQAPRPQLIRRDFARQLELLGGGGADQGFLALIGPVGDIIGAALDQGVTPRRLQYDEREKVVTVDLTAKDFAMLEQLRDRIQQRGLQAEIGSARGENAGVTARMKVGQVI